MSFNKIILLILVFNVVASLIAKRKKAAKAAGEPKTAPPPTPVASESQVKQQPQRTEARPKGSPAKELLAQLAREMGLEIPEEEPEKSNLPEPIPSPEKPSQREEAVPAKATRKKLISAEPEIENSSVDIFGSIQEKITDGIHTEQTRIGNAYAITDDLTNREIMRKNFALKTILDPPLSLNPRQSR